MQLSHDPHARFEIGVDEAGRGPLAGPVAVAAVGVPHVHMQEVVSRCGRLRDSKHLSPQKRRWWLAEIQQMQREGRLAVAVTLVGPQTIDRDGIRAATFRGISTVLRRLALPRRGSRVWLDGGLTAPRTYRRQTTIIKGDEREMLIALASIVAKERRDARMERLAAAYPGYAFEAHKGYGTDAHYRSIRKYGVTEVHRRSFLRRMRERTDAHAASLRTPHRGSLLLRF